MEPNPLADQIENPQLFPQEQIMIQQLQRQQEPLREQQRYFHEWFDYDKSQINKIIVSTDFISCQHHYQDWEFASFYPGGYGVDSAPEIRGKWIPANLHSTPSGLQIRSIILKSRETVTLRSLGCEIRTNFRLQGDSTFWVITRANSIRDPNAMICKIRKEQDSKRIFLIFGSSIGMQGEFRFFKKLEIPEVNDQIPEDYVDIRLVLNDNGDEKVIAQCTPHQQQTGNFSSCSMYIPSLGESYVMIAGSGDNVLLRHMAVKQVKRTQEVILQQSTHQECCLII